MAGKLCAIKDGCHDLGTTHLKDPGKSVPVEEFAGNGREEIAPSPRRVRRPFKVMVNQPGTMRNDDGKSISSPSD